MDFAFRVQYQLEEKKITEMKKAVLAGSYVFSPLKLMVMPFHYPKDCFYQVFVVPEMPILFL